MIAIVLLITTRNAAAGAQIETLTQFGAAIREGQEPRQYQKNRAPPPGIPLQSVRDSGPKIKRRFRGLVAAVEAAERRDLLLTTLDRSRSLSGVLRPERPDGIELPVHPLRDQLFRKMLRHLVSAFTVDPNSFPRYFLSSSSPAGEPCNISLDHRSDRPTTSVIA